MSAATAAPAGAPVLEARGVSKRFGPVCALDGVDLVLRAGEIHALLGENGAGKSTLIRILSGALRPDAGAMTLRGEGFAPRSARDAEDFGVSTVHQEVHLVPDLSVAENIVLGREPTRLGAIRRGAAEGRARHALARLGVTMDVRLELERLPLAVRQLVAISRALDVEASVLVLDEPTSSLDAREAARLRDVLRALRAEGRAILLVSHSLDEVFGWSDRITVLRDGRVAGTHDTRDAARGDVVREMIGRAVESASARSSASEEPRDPRTPVLEARGLFRRRAVPPFSLALRAGEVTGLAGLLGSGRSEIARLLAGVDAADGGALLESGRGIRLRALRHALARGIAFVPEDRRREGIVGMLSVGANLALSMQARRGMLARRERARSGARIAALAERLRIRTPGLGAPADQLSGGNQQKVLIARALALEPRVLVLDEPTRGIDIGARDEIERSIGELAAAGVSVLVVSSEIDQLARLCRRVLVLRDRRIVAELEGAALSEAAIVGAMASDGR